MHLAICHPALVSQNRLSACDAPIGRSELFRSIPYYGGRGPLLKKLFGQQARTGRTGASSAAPAATKPSPAGRSPPVRVEPKHASSGTHARPRRLTSPPLCSSLAPFRHSSVGIRHDPGRAAHRIQYFQAASNARRDGGRAACRIEATLCRTARPMARLRRCAVALRRAQYPLQADNTVARSGPAASAREDLVRVREALSESITTDGILKPGKARVELPTPAPKASVEDAADFAPTIATMPPTSGT